MRTFVQKKACEVYKKSGNILGYNFSNQPQPSFPLLDNRLLPVSVQAICPCDGGCPRCTSAIQPELAIGQPCDKYEQEADRIADEVMRMPEPEVQPKPT